MCIRDRAGGFPGPPGPGPLARWACVARARAALDASARVSVPRRRRSVPLRAGAGAPSRRPSTPAARPPAGCVPPPRVFPPPRPPLPGAAPGSCGGGGSRGGPRDRPPARALSARVLRAQPPALGTRPARRLSLCARALYLVDPASSICLSQRLSHACLSTHGRYSETANGSLNQLWFLWSLAPLLLG